MVVSIGCIFYDIRRKPEKSSFNKIQLKKAIDLLIQDKDFSCAITIAAAVEKMLANILKAKGQLSMLAELHP